MWQADYRHKNREGKPLALPVGKVVCVGRNYADHARELNNPVPQEPVLFMKPSTALCDLARPLEIPRQAGCVHFEAEMAVLVGSVLTANTSRTPDAVFAAIAGIGVGLDLTLRELQSQLKARALPWERAKAFDGAAPVSGFWPVADPESLQDLDITLFRNGQRQQQGNTRDMLFPVLPLMAHMATQFTLLPGDVVLTGTPAGVGPLESGDEIEAGLGDYRIRTRVR